MWFEVDKDGLAKLMERKGKSFAVLELLSNAWDSGAKEVGIHLKHMGIRSKAALTVVDDSPDGFANLSHSWTLFAESTKKGEAEKRGRFNLGEKLVLAICDEATIVSTKGGVRFDADGRISLRTRRAQGTEFKATIRMTKEEVEEALSVLRTCIPPVTTWVNDETIAMRSPRATFEATLPTEVADADGILRRSTRKTTVEVFEPLAGETPTIYEMGIPVVEMDGRWHLNVLQKVPLNFDRDNVTPAYLRALRGLVVDHMASKLTKDEAAANWVTEGLGAANNLNAVRDVVTARYGDKVVSYDPSDRGANQNAQAQGFVVIHGGMLPAEAWEKVRAADAVKPAGQVTPDLLKLSGGGAKPANANDWVNLAPRLRKLLKSISPDRNPGLTFCDDANAGWQGLCDKEGTRLSLNLHGLTLDHAGRITESVLDLVLHEAAHMYEHAHLHTGYHTALTRLGARAALHAARNPSDFAI
jgi:hypothetical protein